MYYLTFNDDPASGVFYSQVVRVCEYLSKLKGAPVKLIAFISIRGFQKNKTQLIAKYPDSIVLPCTPKISTWKWNVIALWLVMMFSKKESVYCRGPLAFSLMNMVRKCGVNVKVGFDGRGAYAAEWNEYDVVPNESLRKQISSLESTAVNEAYFKNAVTEKLVEHWKNVYNYTNENHVVIPCALAAGAAMYPISTAIIAAKRATLGIAKEDVVFVYSGSVAGWQSLGLMEEYLTFQLKRNTKVKVLFLANVDLAKFDLAIKFPGQVKQAWVSPTEVHEYLCCADYGLMIREDKVTNQVASPTKFSEYLGAGLHVVISDGLGDFPAFIENHKCGSIFTKIDRDEKPLVGLDLAEKRRINKLAIDNLSKESFREKYMTILENLA